MRSLTRQSKRMQLLRFLTSLAWAAGARISVRSQNDASTAMSSRIGPDGEPWQTGRKYFCMQKWEKSPGQYVGQFCLVDLEKAHLLASLHLQFALTLEECVSSTHKQSHKMRVCAVKGKASGGRLSWKSRSYVPKACFRYSREEKAYPVIEGAVTEQGCAFIEKSYSVADQGKFGEAIAKYAETTTTTTFHCPSCKDGFISEVVGDQQCDCRPAPCYIMGTINEGLACECVPGLTGDITWTGEIARGECVAEARDLFTVGDMKIWEHKEKEFKCCVSSVGDQTQLQDMVASKLPSEGSFGRSAATGCGYMFGDHYHNGMKPYKSRSYSTCPVPVEKLVKETGESFDVIKKLLMLEDWQKA